MAANISTSERREGVPHGVGRGGHVRSTTVKQGGHKSDWNFTKLIVLPANF